ncbi:MAG TPA: nuclear transport factor 2 family protein [Gemmatimonadaceae bacterium]|jgi:hypothetical protein
MSARRTLILLAGIVAACSNGSVAPVPVADSARVARVITAIENRIGDANFTCDYKFFAAVEAPEFIFTDARGGVTTRVEDLAGESSCRPRKGTYVLDEIRVQHHGDVVVFNARATTTVQRDSGGPAVSRNRFTDVLVRRDTSWVLVAGHSSRIP